MHIERNISADGVFLQCHSLLSIDASPEIIIIVFSLAQTSADSLNVPKTTFHSAAE